MLHYRHDASANHAAYRGTAPHGPRYRETDDEDETKVDYPKDDLTSLDFDNAERYSGSPPDDFRTTDDSACHFVDVADAAESIDTLSDFDIYDDPI